jgi:glycerol-3-phosphate cytidylyltransferase
MKKYKIGYTQGVYDMFHIGHLNLINKAKEQCERLIVGVNSDKLVAEYKHKIPVVNEVNRSIIVGNIKAVDECVIVNTLDKVETLKQLNFNAIFIGDDWYGDPRWMHTAQQLAEYGVDVVFLPHTSGVSSTELRTKTGCQVEE